MMTWVLMAMLAQPPVQPREKPADELRQEVAPAPNADDAAALRLVRIRESRQKFALDSRPATKDATADGDLPGDWLLLDFELPAEGLRVRIVDVEPVSVSVQDDTGKDLVGPAIERRPHAKRFDALASLLRPSPYAPMVRLHVVPSERAAQKVTLSLRLNVRVADGAAREPIKPATTWTAFETAELKAIGAEYRRVQRGDRWHLDVRPRGAEVLIETIEPRRAGSGVRASPSARDSGGMSYVLAAETTGDTPVSVRVFGPLRTYVAAVRMDDLALP